MVGSGPISIGGSATSGGNNESINVELGSSATAQRSLNDSTSRTLAGVASGAISLASFYGKSNRVAVSVTVTGTIFDKTTYVLAQGSGSGWTTTGTYNAGYSDITITINSGAILAGSSTTSGLYVNGVSGDTITIINHGSIYGVGGKGGDSGAYPGNNGLGGSDGGDAVFVTFNVASFTNTGTIAGGGGGGGGGAGKVVTSGQLYNSYGGGGGGAGCGYNAQGGGHAVTPQGADGNFTGSAGNSATNGVNTPGTGGAGASSIGGGGGTGGTFGNTGSVGATTSGGYSHGTGGAGGAAGYAIRKNGYSCPTPGGTIYGTIG